MIFNKVVVVSSHDVANPTAWSGVPYYYTSALKSIARVVVVASPLKPLGNYAAQAKALRYQSLGLLYSPDRDLDVLRERAAEANLLLRRNRDADIIFIFHPPDAAFLETSIPIAIIHDSTWNQYTNTYPRIRSCIAQETYDNGRIAERLAFNKASWIIFFTTWASSAGRQEYPFCRRKIFVVPPGANIDEIPSRDQIGHSIESEQSSTCNILCIGAEVYRKGIDIAADTIFTLRAGGVDATLTLVGAPRHVPFRPMPLDFEGPPFMNDQTIVSYGILKRSIPEERALLDRLYSEASILLVPSRADCGSLALCDAAAFGVPTITSGVGGIGDLITHGKNGFVMGPNGSPVIYAKCVEALWRNRSAYKRLRYETRALYDSVLNWNTHVQRAAEIITGGQ